MKKRLYFVFAALCLLFVLCACESGQEPAELQVYFPCSGDEDGLTYTAVYGESYYGEKSVAGLIEAMETGPTGLGLDKLFDKDVRLLSWSLMSGVLRMDLSPEYGGLDSLEQTLTECCITLTLTQLNGVNKVCITAGGYEVPGRAYRALTADHMILTGAEEGPRQVSMELYFPDADGRGLGVEERELTLAESDDLYTAVAQALLEGPESELLRDLFPEGTELLDAGVDDGICYVNFSAELLDGAPDDPAEQKLLLYSVINTLGSLEPVHAVQVLVEGTVPKNYGNADTAFPLDPDFELLTKAYSHKN